MVNVRALCASGRKFEFQTVAKVGHRFNIYASRCVASALCYTCNNQKIV